MSQHDMDVANGSGVVVRADINAALQALASMNSGASTPNPTFPCQVWGDTGSGRLKQRNSANTAWLDRGALDSPGDLPLSGGTLTGALNNAPLVTIASSATPAIGAAAANTITITGTTGITGFDSIASGAVRTLVFSGILTLTHNPTSLILPKGANITTAAGDVLQFTSLGGGNWRYSGSASWGSLSGALTAQTDLVAEFAKYPLKPATGNFVTVYASAGAAAFLPAGGTWAYSLMYVNGSGATFPANTASGVAAGGLAVAAGVTGISWSGLAWKIA